MSDQPNLIEPVPVQLTRIEGTINLIAYQMGEVRTELTELGKRVSAVELVQAANSGSSKSWQTWLPIIATIVATGAGVLALYR